MDQSQGFHTYICTRCIKTTYQINYQINIKRFAHLKYLYVSVYQSRVMRIGFYRLIKKKNGRVRHEYICTQHKFDSVRFRSSEIIMNKTVTKREKERKQTQKKC